MARAQQAAWRLLVAAAAAIGPVAVVLLGPTFEILRRNEDLIGSDASAARWLLWGALLAWGVGTALALAPDRRGFRWALAAFLCLGPGWILYRATAGASEGLALGLFLAFFVAAPLAAGWVLSRAPRARVATGFAVVGLAFALPVVPTALGPHRDKQVAAATAGETSDSKLPNVYHVVFDEFQSDFFSERLNEELARKFSGFTFFPEAITPYGRTDMALPSIFTGVAYDYKVPPVQYMWSAFFDPNVSLLHKVKEAGYRTEGYLHLIYPRVKQSPFDTTVFHVKQPKVTVDSSSQAGLVASMWAYGSLPPALVRAVVPETYLEQLSGGVLLPTQAPVASLNSVRHFLRTEHRRAANGRYVFLHLLLPHLPHVLDQDCNFLNGERVPASEQHGCAIKVMRDFVDELARLGRLENSLVIFQSDHGLGYHRSGGKLVSGGNIFSLPYVYGRSRVLLMVKKPGAAMDEALVTSPAPATLLDIAPTVVDAIGLAPWTVFSGVSLLGGEVPPRPERFYHMYEKDHHKVVKGTVRRYRLDENGWQVDAEIPVPQADTTSLKSSEPPS